MPTLRFGNDTHSGTGVRFDMRAETADFIWNNFIQAEQHPGKAITSGLDVRLPTGRYMGHDIPSVRIAGIIDTSLADPTYNSDANPFITVSGLGALSLIGSGYLLYPAVTQFLGKAPTGTGSISAMIRNVTMSSNNQFTRDGSEYVVRYNAEFLLVSGPV